MAIKNSRRLAVSVAAAALAFAAAYSASAQHAGSAGAQESALTEERVREIVIEQIRKNPSVIVESLNAYMQDQKTAEDKQATEKVISKKADIAATEGLPFVGNPEGAVELVYFFDVNCGYCKRLEPSIKRIVAENSDVKVSHRELPILAESSRLAAYLEGLVWRKHPEKYASFHEALIGHKGGLTQADVEAMLAEAIGPAEADRMLQAVDSLDSDPDAREVNNRIQENLAIAHAAGITGTPFVYVLQGDGLLRGAGDDAYEQLSAMVKKARAAGE